MSGVSHPTRVHIARSRAITSRIMASVRSRDNRAEKLLRGALSRRGLRYRLHPRRAGGEPVPGKPDIVFSGSRVIAFVDGDFWHGRLLLEHGRWAFLARFRPALRKWWLQKIGGNVARDQTVTRALRANGWLVLRFWESDVLKFPERVANAIERAVSRRLGQRSV
jgi:DNA mismatch endonuclease (patch repair protein)